MNTLQYILIPVALILAICLIFSFYIIIKDLIDKNL